MSATTKTWLNGNPPQLDDTDLNGFKNENNNLIESAGLTLNDGNNDQTTQAISIYSLGAQYLEDSGIANSYVLSPPDNKLLPPNYFTGMTVLFIPANSNTGVSSVNIGGIGIKSIVETDGGPLQSGDIVAGTVIQITYDGVNFRITFSQNSSGERIIINPTVITATTTISAANINRVYEVDCTAGNVDITIPPFSGVVSGSFIQFNRIDSTNNKLTILGNGADLISSYNDHVIYGKDSTFKVVAYNTQWKVNEYYDSIATFWKAYFSVTTQNLNGGVVIWPTLYPSYPNISSCYNTVTGIALLPIRGEWLVNAGGSNNSSVSTTSTMRLNLQFNGVEFPGSLACNHPNNSSNELGITMAVTIKTTLNSVDEVRVTGDNFTIGPLHGNVSGFSGTLIKRLI